MRLDGIFTNDIWSKPFRLPVVSLARRSHAGDDTQAVRVFMAKAMAILVATGLMVLAMPAKTAPPVSIPDNSAYILTPPAPARPRINGPAVFGVRPGSPILYHVPVTGDRPMRYSARGLPDGVRLDGATGDMTGRLAAPGTYTIMLQVRNSHGNAHRTFLLKVGDEIALTPPLGWNSYNVWGTQINQRLALAAAHAMVSSGLIEHGWSYINLDDGWQGLRAGPFNALQPDAERFGDFQGMVDEIHHLGLKVGLYSTPWVKSYGGRLGGSAENPEGSPQTWPGNPARNKHQLPYDIGKYHFADNDAKQYAAWGIDYLKYDWGPVEYPETKEMFDALRDQRRDIVYSLSNNAAENLLADIGQVSTVANAWRTTHDIVDSWKRVSQDIGFAQTDWAPFARPGHYNDTDMLVVGVVGWGKEKQHYTRLTPDEQYSHISLWALLSSPLILGNDLEKLDPFTLSLLTNDEVLAVDQDALVNQALPVAQTGNAIVYRKKLEDGSQAVGLFNTGEVPANVTVKWSDIGLTGKHKVRDLWRQKNLGNLAEAFTATVAPHGVVLVHIGT